MNVVATGAISKSDICMISSEAFEIMTPPPARIIGYSAFASKSGGFADFG